MNIKFGDHLVIQITGMLGYYIAEVIGTDPVTMKVQESGPFSNLREGDFIICEAETEKLQKDDRDNGSAFLESMVSQGRKVMSGLASLGVTDGRLHEILPA